MSKKNIGIPLYLLRCPINYFIFAPDMLVQHKK